MRRIRLSVIVATALATLAVAVPAAASASTHRSAAKPPAIKTQQTGMTIVPVVRILGATPRKPGYFTVLAANGKEAIVPNSLKSRVESRMKQDLIHPLLYDESVGDCGTSFINITTKSNGYMVFRATGFTVVLPAIYFSWSYGLQGPSYPAITFKFSDPLDFDSSWANRVSSAYNYPNGTWSGAVSQTSYADLDNGDICYSGGPAVRGYV
jgi:hypothetical protein